MRWRPRPPRRSAKRSRLVSTPEARRLVWLMVGRSASGRSSRANGPTTTSSSARRRLCSWPPSIARSKARPSARGRCGRRLLPSFQRSRTPNSTSGSVTSSRVIRTISRFSPEFACLMRRAGQGGWRVCPVRRSVGSGWVTEPAVSQFGLGASYPSGPGGSQRGVLLTAIEICPLAATRNCPEMPMSVTERDCCVRCCDALTVVRRSSSGLHDALAECSRSDIMGGCCAAYCCATPFGTSVLSPRQNVVR